jgi:hypothetical protein
VARVVLIITDGELPVCRSAEWTSVPRKGEQVSVPEARNVPPYLRTVTSVVWHDDGSAHVFLDGWIDGNCSDMLIRRHQWSRYEASPS